MMTNASVEALAYQVKRDQKAFTDAAERVAELAEFIAMSPAQDVGGHLSRLSQQVTTLVSQAATIKATLEMVEMLNAAAEK
ncbi:hypothetical protein DN402_31680 [Streptomyces sp. SW4]|nr:hypothetical protein DN402_31680 [Streptomyces sp. SW4]